MKFLLGHSVRTVNEISVDLFGAATCHDQVCGHGSKTAIGWIRKSSEALADKSDGQILQLIHNKQVKQARESEIYRQSWGLVIRHDGFPEYDINGRALDSTDAECGTCEPGYRPVTKTMKSSTKSRTIRGKRWGQPLLGSRCELLSNYQKESAEKTLEMYETSDIAKKPPEAVYLLDTENLEVYPDAFDSGDEEKEERRAQRERELYKATYGKYPEEMKDDEEAGAKKPRAKRKPRKTNGARKSTKSGAGKGNKTGRRKSGTVSKNPKKERPYNERCLFNEEQYPPSSESDYSCHEDSE